MTGNVSAKIRVGGLDGFRRLLLSWNVDPRPIIERAGLTEEILDSPDQMIEANIYRTVLNLAAESSGRRDFGLQLSQRQGFEKLGAVGFLARHAPNLEIAIDRVVRYLRIFDTGSVSNLERDENYVLWTHTLTGLGEESPVQQHELAIGLACGFIQSAIGENWAPDCVYFEHSAPRDMTPFLSLFRCPVFFEQTLNGLEFPASYLESPLRGADPGLFAILDEHVSGLDAGPSSNIVARIRSVLQSKLETGKPGIDEVAREMNFKKHMLQRRLKREGTTFRALLDDVRFDLGRRYLRDTSLSISEIASVLGYSETAVFTRAFRRRSGLTPRQWRQSR